MATYTSKNGHLGATDEVSGGCSYELTYTSNAKIRNAELKLVLVDCLKMIKRIAELESALHKSELKIISLESELSTSKAWYKIAEEEMATLNKQLKGDNQ